MLYFEGIQISQNSLHLNHIKTELSEKNVCIVLVNANLLNGKNVDLPNDNMFLTDELNSNWPSHEKKNCCFFNCCCESAKTCSMADLDDIVALNLAHMNNEKSSNNNNYSGHFIILIGYDDSKRLIFYRNPASKRNLSFTSYLNFELARKSYGTDQDILFLYI